MDYNAVGWVLGEEKLEGSRRMEVSMEGVADIEELGETASFGRLRTQMVIERLRLWWSQMELRKRRALVGVVLRIVVLAPWEEKTFAISIIGICWPPPT
ncbi:hypothetical protein Pyn_07670 [Prunus yedoensis var. nudiflora]|uniref:Uncharacterized protein n=1 Tax=Prunus yedoensis var. nudiflora TaxID=2094558 RepID=A0A314YAA1_PRUYE|nr:hypothetical protein Pyn_07670 [Prunus yedoensis var. nudiflora]